LDESPARFAGRGFFTICGLAAVIAQGMPAPLTDVNNTKLWSSS
jgi:hypothetical protein